MHLVCFQPSGPQHCVWWDFEASSSYGAWKKDGCHVHRVVGDVIVCACSHLTNFAVMMVSTIYTIDLKKKTLPDILHCVVSGNGQVRNVEGE